MRAVGERVSQVWTAVPIIGESREMTAIKEMIDLFGPGEIPVLINGESGTGKELVATGLHEKSMRARGPFVAINCAAIPEGLIESEILGHEKGAFTGAIKDKRGVFAQAHGGTVFLDEIGDMPLFAQAKLLRVLQEKEVRPVGAERTIKIDCRVIAATNRDLREAVLKGTFRQDLYYRICGVNIRIPALRERVSDIPLLVEHFIEQHRPYPERGNGKCAAGISREALQLLMDYSFPGNIRELSACVEQALIRARGCRIGPEHLPVEMVEKPVVHRGSSTAAVRIEALRAAIEAVTMKRQEGDGAERGKAMRIANVEEICGFLAQTNGEEFARKDFEIFLSSRGGNDRNTNRCATAGRYLKIFKEKGILERNDGKANQTRFRLSGDLVKQG